jgi:hypothetical protein
MVTSVSSFHNNARNEAKLLFSVTQQTMITKTAAPQRKSSFTTIDIHLSRSESSASSSSSLGEFLDDTKKTKKHKKKEFDAKRFLENRVMSPLQEACNAVTMLPQMIYSAYFVLSGCWTNGATEMATQVYVDLHESNNWMTRFLGDEYRWAENLGCINHPVFPHLTALPPPAVLMVAFAGIVHPIFSVVFHWYCMRLEP